MNCDDVVCGSIVGDLQFEGESPPVPYPRLLEDRTDLLHLAAFILRGERSGYIQILVPSNSMLDVLREALSISSLMR